MYIYNIIYIDMNKYKQLIEKLERKYVCDFRSDVWISIIYTLGIYSCLYINVIYEIRVIWLWQSIFWDNIKRISIRCYVIKFCEEILKLLSFLKWSRGISDMKHVPWIFEGHHSRGYKFFQRIYTKMQLLRSSRDDTVSVFIEFVLKPRGFTAYITAWGAHRLHNVSKLDGDILVHLADLGKQFLLLRAGFRKVECMLVV